MSLRVTRAALLVLAAIVLVGAAGCGGEPVPDIVGRRYETADFLLQNAGFRLGEVDYDEDAEGPPGFIIEQSPRAQRRATPGDEVDIVISGALLVRVPRLVGAKADDVRELLGEAHLRRGPCAEEHNDYFPEGMVIAQSLSPGSLAPADTKVSYTVSLGPEDAPVPGVVGRWEDEARSFLLSIGFPTRIDRENSAEPPGVVIGQWPDARTELDLGERVELVVSEGPDTVVVPDVRGMALDRAIDELSDAGMRPTARVIGGADEETAVVLSQQPVGGYVTAVGVSVVLYAHEPE